MKKNLKVLLIIHPELNPLKQGLTAAKHVDSPCKTEAHVYSTLKALGHSPEFLELEHNLDPLMEKVKKEKIDLVFNLLEELKGEAKFDFHAVSYLESRGIRFTGSGPRALILTRDKSLSKMVVDSLGVLTPKSVLIRSLKDLKKIKARFPAFVKINTEDASLGIEQKNRVENEKALEATCKRLFKLTKGSILIEEFIPGDDLSIGILGNKNPFVLPTRKLSMPHHNWIAGEGVKFNSDLRLKHRIRSKTKLWSSEKEKKKFEAQALRIYQELGLRGYARLDFRIDPDNKIYFLEANANPDISKDEDFGLSAKTLGIKYSELISKIVELSLSGG